MCSYRSKLLILPKSIIQVELDLAARAPSDLGSNSSEGFRSDLRSPSEAQKSAAP